MELSEYRRVIAEAAGPLKERLSEIEDLIASLKTEKTEIETILRKTDQLPVKNGKPKTKVTPNQVSEETLERFVAKLRELPHGELIYASALAEDPRFDWLSGSSISKALIALHDRDVIALHSTGIGGRKNYVVLG